MNQFLPMSNMLSRRRRHQTQSLARVEAPRMKTTKRPSRIVIPKGDGEKRRRRQEEKITQEADPSDHREIGPWVKRKRKEKRALLWGPL